MSETSNHAAAPAATPAPASGTFGEVTNGERTLAVLALAFAALLALMAVDMLTGGRVSGVITSRTGGDDE